MVRDSFAGRHGDRAHLRRRLTISLRSWHLVTSLLNRLSAGLGERLLPAPLDSRVCRLVMVLCEVRETLVNVACVAGLVAAASLSLVRMATMASARVRTLRTLRPTCTRLLKMVSCVCTLSLRLVTTWCLLLVPSSTLPVWPSWFVRYVVSTGSFVNNLVMGTA